MMIPLTGLIIVYECRPILIKYWSGTAKDLGEPIKGEVYTDGHLNEDIKLFRYINFYDGQAMGYILSLKDFDKEGMLRFIHVDLTDTVIGRSIATDSADYYILQGHLFQSESAFHYVDFRDDMKGFGFNPALKFNSREITFNIPPNYLKFNSIKIVLN